MKLNYKTRCYHHLGEGKTKGGIILSNKNILITGGAGFIGSNIIKRAVPKGYNVYCLDYRDDIDNLNGIVNRLNLINQDVRDKEVLETLFKNHEFDGVIHLAAVSRVIWAEQEPNKCWDINVNGTKTLLETLKTTGQDPWFIFGSSREVYGENGNFPISEDHKKDPINIYGESKLTGEKLVKKWSIETGNSSAVLRFSNVYGNENDILDRVIPRFILRALRKKVLKIHGGDQLIDFTHISDTVDGVFRTIDYLNKDMKIFDDFHILPGQGTTLHDVVNYISNSIDNEPKVKITEGRDYDVDKFVGDPTKAKSKLDFSAEIEPEEGISKTIDRYREVFTA